MRGTLSQPLLIHVHPVVFVGWLVLFLTQVVLAAAGHVKWHLRLGRFGFGYGALVVAVGLVTGISRSADRVRTGRSPNGLLLDVTMAMTLFSIFFGAAIVFRRTPRLHRRLMTVAATMLLVAAAGRMTFLPFPVMWLAVWALPILLAMAYDYRKHRVLHPVCNFRTRVRGAVHRAHGQLDRHRLLGHRASRIDAALPWTAGYVPILTPDQGHNVATSVCPSSRTMLTEQRKS